MTIETAENGGVRLVGACSIEDAELLLQRLSAVPEPVVDWRGCSNMHASVLQVLLAARPRMMGPPDDDFLSRMLEPLLNGSD